MKLFYTLLMVAGVSAIYPADHWSYSTKLSNTIADDFIKENVDAGKTVFVRWMRRLDEADDASRHQDGTRPSKSLVVMTKLSLQMLICRKKELI